MGAGNPPAEGGDVFGEYLRAKAEADRALAASGLAYTIVRPGSLTDDPPTGLVTIGGEFDLREVPRPTSPRLSPLSSTPTTRSARRSSSWLVRRRSRRPSQVSDA